MWGIRLGQTEQGWLAATKLPPARPPGPNEISVRLRASSLNHHDYLVMKGIIPSGRGRIPLSDGAGEVTAIGTGVTDLMVGDSVISLFFPGWIDGQRLGEGFETVPGDGIDGYAREEITARADAFTRAPRGLSHAQSATLPCAGLTAWRALVPEGRLKAGDTVLVQGTGGVALFALQIAKAMGATVVATSSSDEKLNRLAALGADHLINYRTTEAWGKDVLGLTKGRGVDHVVEIGGWGTLEQSMIAARPGGQIVMIGGMSGNKNSSANAMIIVKELTVRGITVGSRRHQLDFIAAIETLGIKPVIDRHFSLKSLFEAVQYQEEKMYFGKIVIDI